MLEKLTNLIYLTSTTISALVYITVWNTPVRKIFTQKNVFILGKLKKLIYLPSTTIPALVYITVWNTPVRKIFTQKNVFILGKLKKLIYLPSTTIPALVYITVWNTPCKKDILHLEKKLPFLYSFPASYTAAMVMQLQEHLLLHICFYDNFAFSS